MSLAPKFATTLLIAGFSAAVACAGTFTVEAGKTKPLRLKGKAASVVVGDPNIADVAVHNDQLLFVTGKTYGTTNLIIFDKAGHTLYSGDLAVSATGANQVNVNRAGEDSRYSCTPTCRNTEQD